MTSFVTRQHWEWRTPPALRLAGEAYWKQVELPLHSAAYIVNTSADPKANLPRRSIAVASIERLLELHAELGEEGMQSVYLLVRRDDGIVMQRVRSIQVGKDEADEWRSAFRVNTEGGEAWDDHEGRSFTSLTDAARFP